MNSINLAAKYEKQLEIHDFYFIHTKTEEFIQRNIAGRKSKMARDRQKQLDRIDKIETLEQKEFKPAFHFHSVPLTGTEHLQVKHLSVGYHSPILPETEPSEERVSK